jgi:hypothetical protein
MTEAEIGKAHDKARSDANKWCRDLVEIKVSGDTEEYFQDQVSVSHKTVRDFLRTQEMQKQFLKYPICQVGPLKGLCMAYLALVKIWPTYIITYTVRHVLVLAKSCEERESATPLEILDDLDMTTEVVTRQKHGPAEYPRLDSESVLEGAVCCGLTLYLGICLDRDPSCVFDIWKAALPSNSYTSSSAEVKPSTVKIIGRVVGKGLRSKLCPGRYQRGR